MGLESCDTNSSTCAASEPNASMPCASAVWQHIMGHRRALPLQVGMRLSCPLNPHAICARLCYPLRTLDMSETLTTASVLAKQICAPLLVSTSRLEVAPRSLSIFCMPHTSQILQGVRARRCPQHPSLCGEFARHLFLGEALLAQVLLLGLLLALLAALLIHSTAPLAPRRQLLAQCFRHQLVPRLDRLRHSQPHISHPPEAS